MKEILPITYDGTFRLDIEEAKRIGAEYWEKYNSNAPYPHIYLDDFIPEEIIDNLYNEFPKENHVDDLNFEGGYSGLHKRLIKPENTKSYTYAFFQFLNSAPILAFLENMTGIKGLIPDPDFNGGGLHEIKTGGLLGVHVDFRIHDRLKLQRRMNLLIYLNKDWDTEWGGQLGIWNKDVTEEIEVIDPLFNRCALFNTDESSYHGHPDPLSCPNDVTRKSIAMYYYTASDAIFSEIPANSTIYVPRESDNFKSRIISFKVRLYSVLKDCLPPILFRLLRSIMGGKESLK